MSDLNPKDFGFRVKSVKSAKSPKKSRKTKSARSVFTVKLHKPSGRWIVYLNGVAQENQLIPRSAWGGENFGWSTKASADEQVKRWKAAAKSAKSEPKIFKALDAYEAALRKSEKGFGTVMNVANAHARALKAGASALQISDSKRDYNKRGL